MSFHPLSQKTLYTPRPQTSRPGWCNVEQRSVPGWRPPGSPAPQLRVQGWTRVCSPPRTQEALFSLRVCRRLACFETLALPRCFLGRRTFTAASPTRAGPAGFRPAPSRVADSGRASVTPPSAVTHSQCPRPIWWWPHGLVQSAPRRRTASLLQVVCTRTGTVQVWTHSERLRPGIRTELCKGKLTIFRKAHPCAHLPLPLPMALLEACGAQWPSARSSLCLPLPGSLQWCRLSAKFPLPLGALL